MDPQELIGLLWVYGHFRNPAHPNCHNVQEADLSNLTIGSHVVQEAARSYQEFFHAELDLLAFHEHRRFAVADGDVGPATERILAMPRCGVPEFGNHEEANWPESCRRELKFGRNFEHLAGLSRQDTDDIWWGVCNAWEAASDDTIITAILDITVDPLTLDIHATAGRLSGSTLAWSELARNRCDVTLNQKYRTNSAWRKDPAVTTAAHEVGHALGHQHTRDSSSLMYPSINSAAIARRGMPNDTDLAQHRRLGYSVRSNPVAPAGDQLWRPRGGEVPPLPPTGEHNGLVILPEDMPAGTVLKVRMWK